MYSAIIKYTLSYLQWFKVLKVNISDSETILIVSSFLHSLSEVKIFLLLEENT